MNKIITIVKKELNRFFSDKKLAFTTILLPGLMIYVMYSFMGQAFTGMFGSSEVEIPRVAISGQPTSLETQFNILPIEIETIGNENVESYQQKIENSELDLIVIFPENFDELVENRSEIPNIEIYYNSTSNQSADAYSMVNQVLVNYEESISNVFTINETEQSYDLASDQQITGQIFSSMLPMLLLIFIFSASMGVATESIAGEKERGTIATLLATPMKRSDLALGKIISLSLIALLSGASSFIGVMASLPKLMGAASDSLTASYGISDYVLLFLIIIVTVLVIISVISIISCYTSSVKQANTAVMPVMIIVMFIGISSMMIGSSTPNILMYCIPLYNSALCMNNILAFDYQMVNILITVVVNLAFTGACTFVLTKLFNNEKVMFSK